MQADFRSLFGHEPAVTASAPGRVNLIGEHTDYNGGFVLPTAIPQRTTVCLSPRADRTVRAASPGIDATTYEYQLGGEEPRHRWLDYVQGTTKLLEADGQPISGFEAAIASDVPVGSGLSSSAALDVALLQALRHAFGLKIDEVALARLAQRVENEFVGAHVGIMDPMAASLADAGTALFIDTRSLAYKRLPLPTTADLVVINSGIEHRHSAGDYNTRRRECEEACKLLDVRQLRDLGVADLPRLQDLPDVLRRRARHVITEDQRVLDAVAALQAGDVRRLGELFFASHESQRRDHEVSIPEIDRLVELARQQPHVFGARLTGGGFGGSVVMLARRGTGGSVSRAIVEQYSKETGQRATVLVPAGAVA
jgi:galactokinase